MKLNTKKKFSYFVIGLLFFLGGVEYGKYFANFALILLALTIA